MLPAILRIGSMRTETLRCMWVAMGLCIILAIPARGFGQAAAEADLKPQNRTLITGDNLTLSFTYWPSALAENAPVVILLHMNGGNRLDWPSAFTTRLQEEGYAVIAPDLRGHGESKGNQSLVSETEATTKKTESTGATIESQHLKGGDYVLMVGSDVEGIKDFIHSEHQARKLNMTKLAIIGAEMGASVAATYSIADWLKLPHSDAPTLASRTPRGQDVRAVVMLSPMTSFTGLPLTKPLRTLKEPAWNIAFLVCVGKKDKEDKGNARKIYQQLATPDKNKDRMYFQEYESPLRGTNLLGKGLRTEDHIIAFLQKHVKDLNIEWRDRESRLGRKPSSDSK